MLNKRRETSINCCQLPAHDTGSCSGQIGFNKLERDICSVRVLGDAQNANAKKSKDQDSPRLTRRWFHSFLLTVELVTISPVDSYMGTNFDIPIGPGGKETPPPVVALCPGIGHGVPFLIIQIPLSITVR